MWLASLWSTSFYEGFRHLWVSVCLRSWNQLLLGKGVDNCICSGCYLELLRISLWIHSLHRDSVLLPVWCSCCVFVLLTPTSKTFIKYHPIPVDGPPFVPSDGVTSVFLPLSAFILAGCFSDYNHVGVPQTVFSVCWHSHAISYMW